MPFVDGRVYSVGMAQSAIDYLESHEETEDATGLLRAVLKTAKGFGENATSD
tara:strand:+ start:405 stop:560 length:156 start_codon:yes stop_codon:yes gene_type:complete